MAAPATAHRPLFPPEHPNSPSRALLVPQPAVSTALYDQLGGGGETHYYRLGPVPGRRLHVELLVPDTPQQRSFRPQAVVLGPGLPRPPARPRYWVPQGGGAQPLMVSPPRRFYEPFTQTAYLVLASQDLHLPAAGPYWLAVHAPGRAGKYVLVVGRQERFGALDLLAFPVWWLQVRLFVYPAFTTVAILLAAALLAVLLAWLLARWRRKRRQRPGAS